MSISRWCAGISLSVLLATLCAAWPPTSAQAAEIAPPAPDETLVYVLRVGRFAGGGVKVWVAVNDQTVAKLANKGYAVVRAKAGAITLNLAAQGTVLAAIALDDRPGQTVYLQWRLGDDAFEELDQQKGRELVNAAEQTEPIDKVLPNNEQTRALLNLSRLGFDVMRPAGEKMSPDSEHAVVTIFRKEESPKLNFGVWAEDRYLGTLSANEGVDVRLTPGEHYFLSGNVGTTLLKAQVEAGKHYYAWIDVGEMVLRVKMMPVTTKESAQLNDWLSHVTFVQVDSDKMTPRAHEREATVTAFVRSAGERARSGHADFTELGSNDAY